MNSVFLTAEWRKLAMINYEVNPFLLKPYLPQGTELDLWDNRCYLSLVAFLFINTKVRGCRVPFHADFEEINLRFYVRYNDQGVWKRGVVFIREFVPLRMVTLVANNLYQEKYQRLPMQHSLQITPEKLRLSYRWKKSGWYSLTIEAINDPQPIIEGSKQEFITQHFWGYSQKSACLSEYQVAHEPWKAYEISRYTIDVDFMDCYGKDFQFLQHTAPASAFLAEDSAIQVYKDRKIY